jgi:hypothetical protein
MGRYYRKHNISAKESIRHWEGKRHKPWFDEECSELVDRRKQAKLQWLQDPSEVIEDNLSNVRQEASRHFRNKKWEYMKDNINELESNSKNKNIWDTHEFKKDYQPRTDLVMDKGGDLLAEPHEVWNAVQGAVVLGRQKYTAEPFVPWPTASEFEVATGNYVARCWSDSSGGTAFWKTQTS